MTLSRRNVLAGLGAVGVGAAAAGARLLTAPVADAKTLGAAAPSPSAFGAGPSTTASSAAAAGGAATPSASAAAAAMAGASPSATASATQTPSTSPTPVASRTMPGAAPAVTATAQPAPRRSGSSTAAFVSGASCIGAADGQFGRWRGRAAAAASTWGRDGETYVVDPGKEFGSWRGSLDYAPQYDLERTGSPFSWEAMRQGAFDERLRSDMRRLKACWGSKQGTLYYRFQHEFNGDWYRWSVDEDNAAAMVAGWRRMAGVFRDVFGDDRRFKITWSPNAGSAPKKYRNVLSAWPGAEYVDVVGIDYYDFFRPTSAGEWNRMHSASDGGGGPMGMGAWQRFAQREGVAWAVPEWGNQYGDNPYYIQRMHDFFAEHAASGGGPAAGRLVYEVYFNQVFDGSSVGSSGDFRVQVDGADHPGRPNAARRYRELFGG